MKPVALFLSLIFILPSLAPLKARAQSASCENGECLPGLVSKLEDLSSLYKKQCLPQKKLSDEDIKNHHEWNGLTEQCWKYLTEINHLESELEKHQARLESKLGCESGACQVPPGPANDLNAQLASLNKIEQDLSCSEARKNEIKKSCGKELGCVLMASNLGMTGYVAELMKPKSNQPSSCHLGNDSCMTQLATGFLDAAISFFEGAWGLLKMGGKAVGKKAGQFWNWVRGADDHASNAQLAMAKASEEEGVFKMLMDDFPGTMGKIFEAFVASIKEWLKSDIFCQKWSGAPHLSNCLKPTESFDCISCRSMATGLCAITGTLVAEIVPAFLTGGLLTAAKQGVNGTQKIAKLFRVSSKGMDTIKNSRLAKLALEASDKATKAAQASKTLKAVKTAIEISLGRARSYLLSPTRKLMKTSFGALSALTKKGNLFIAQTKTGKILVFSGKALKTTSKIVIYPIENPMTVWAFNSGQRSFEALFRLGAPQLAKTSLTVSVMSELEPGIQKTIAQLEAAKIPNRPNAKKLLELEESLLKRIESKRLSALKAILEKDRPDFDEIIKYLYPELQYGPLAQKVGSAKVISLEKELLEEISRMQAGPLREELLKRFEQHLAPGEARQKIIGKIELLPEDAYPALKAITIPEIKADTMARMMTDQSYSSILLRAPLAQRRSIAKALKLLENAGFSPAEATLIFKRHEKSFKYVMEASLPDSDSAAMLAEFIKRERKAGMTDELITQKLDEALQKTCNLP